MNKKEISIQTNSKAYRWHEIQKHLNSDRPGKLFTETANIRPTKNFIEDRQNVCIQGLRKKRGLMLH